MRIERWPQGLYPRTDVHGGSRSSGFFTFRASQFLILSLLCSLLEVSSLRPPSFLSVFLLSVSTPRPTLMPSSLGPWRVGEALDHHPADWLTSIYPTLHQSRPRNTRVAPTEVCPNCWNPSHSSLLLRITSPHLVTTCRGPFPASSAPLKDRCSHSNSSASAHSFLTLTRKTSTVLTKLTLPFIWLVIPSFLPLRETYRHDSLYIFHCPFSKLTAFPD